MAKINLSSTVLVPCSQLEQPFKWVGTLNLSNNEISNEVHVILFACSSVNGIRELIEKCIREFKAGPQDFKVCNNIAYLEKLLKQMSQSIFCKELGQALLETIADKLQLTLDARDIIYLSGVRNMSN